MKDQKSSLNLNTSRKQLAILFKDDFLLHLQTVPPGEDSNGVVENKIEGIVPYSHLPMELFVPGDFVR